MDTSPAVGPADVRGEPSKMGTVSLGERLTSLAPASGLVPSDRLASSLLYQQLVLVLASPVGRDAHPGVPSAPSEFIIVAEFLAEAFPAERDAVDRALNRLLTTSSPFQALAWHHKLVDTMSKVFADMTDQSGRDGLYQGPLAPASLRATIMDNQQEAIDWFTHLVLDPAAPVTDRERMLFGVLLPRLLNTHFSGHGLHVGSDSPNSLGHKSEQVVREWVDTTAPLLAAAFEQASARRRRVLYPMLMAWVTWAHYMGAVPHTMGTERNDPSRLRYPTRHLPVLQQIVNNDPVLAYGAARAMMNPAPELRAKASGLPANRDGFIGMYEEVSDRWPAHVAALRDQAWGAAGPQRGRWQVLHERALTIPDSTFLFGQPYRPIAVKTTGPVMDPGDIVVVLRMAADPAPVNRRQVIAALNHGERARKALMALSRADLVRFTANAHRSIVWHLVTFHAPGLPVEVLSSLADHPEVRIADAAKKEVLGRLAQT
jgi:hypothetical protein